MKKSSKTTKNEMVFINGLLYTKEQGDKVLSGIPKKDLIALVIRFKHTKKGLIQIR